MRNDMGKKGVYQRYSGQVSNNDRENAKIAVLEDARFDTVNYWIVDSLEIKEYLLNTIAAGTLLPVTSGQKILTTRF